MSQVDEAAERLREYHPCLYWRVARLAVAAALRELECMCEAELPEIEADSYDAGYADGVRWALWRAHFLAARLAGEEKD